MWQKTIEIIDGLATFAAPVQSTKNKGYKASDSTEVERSASSMQ